MATRLINDYRKVTDYTQAEEDTLAGTLTGLEYGAALIYNTTLGTTRVWDGASFASVVIAAGTVNGANQLVQMTAANKLPAVDGSLLTNLPGGGTPPTGTGFTHQTAGATDAASKTYAETKALLSLDNVNNTSDANKPVSTATQTALDLKAPTASPTFTGTVAGITAAMVGAPAGSGTSSGTNTGDQTLPVKATGAEVDTGTDDAKFLTPKAIEDSLYIKAAYADAKVTDAIVDGVTTVAPSQNAVFDGLALKKADSMSTNKLLGRGTAGTGVIEEITLGTNLSFTGTTLNATGGGSVSITEVEIDVGATPVAEASIAVANASISAASRILGGVAYKAPTGKDLDELEMDALELKFEPAAGSMNVHVKGLEGYIADKFTIWYTFA